ncbi:MAG TPA: 16S rRNA (cytosine(1402)-N(4))-methyltransferase RsmH [Kofleriaceae bacterium]|nr:16S rRNA (cytosine(1402)-N(4))-methyltransferase RsmH [Kofleriaceae bacterium]
MRSDFVHASVLAREVIAELSPQNDKVYVDGTLGGAGHASLVLAHAPGARLIGIDRDPTALAASREALTPFGDRAQIVHGDYDQMPEILAGLGIARVDGILLDLGVSSPQLDVAERGFSFARPGPLDMRMDPTQGPTAHDLLRELSEPALADVIFTYGEERYSKKIARLIKAAIDRVHTTTELAAVIAQAIPVAEQRKSKIHPATRTFQALRIAVNRELEQLERFLAAFPDLLAPGGRCAIISFHSLEDRLVKLRFRDLAWTSSLPPAFAAREGERAFAVCEPVTRKAVVAADDELAANPRARSARLRVCERTAAPNVPSGAPAGAIRRD